MSLFKLLGSIVAIIIVLSSLGFYLNIMDSSVRMANGDPSASDDFDNAVADEVVGTVQWGFRCIHTHSDFRSLRSNRCSGLVEKIR
jgi:hypothetical protein